MWSHRHILTWSLTLAVALTAAESRPNILIIVSDDQGWADAGFQGSKDLRTPHLDALAASGVRCTNGYVSHPFCSPTRAGLLTGRYQQRFGHENNPFYNPNDAREGLPLGERLMPQVFAAAGWRTGWVGKWHLGATPAHAPWARGFQDTFGFIGGGHHFRITKVGDQEYDLPIVRSGTPVQVTEHLTTRQGTEAAAFIRSNKDSPWLLYLAFNAPHTPNEPTAERLEHFNSIADPKRRSYAAQVSLLDDAIGATLAAVQDTGARERTLIFFFSDNGGPLKANGSDNGPLRGQKGQVYEGGVRVPFLVSWPSRLPAGKAYDQPVSSLDVFATAVAVAKIDQPEPPALDGVNIVPYLAGEANGRPHERLFWRMGGGTANAVREGDWKLVRTQGKEPELYNLAMDPNESTDCSAEKPEVVAHLLSVFKSWNQELVPPSFPGPAGRKEAQAKGKEQ